MSDLAATTAAAAAAGPAATIGAPGPRTGAPAATMEAPAWGSLKIVLRVKEVVQRPPSVVATPRSLWLFKVVEIPGRLVPR